MGGPEGLDHGGDGFDKAYAEWVKNSKHWLAEAKRVNAWAKRAKRRLLEDIGPRISRLAGTGYYGCGFHYDMERKFARCIRDLSICWQPSASHCQKVKDDAARWMIAEIMVEELIKEVREAEASTEPGWTPKR